MKKIDNDTIINLLKYDDIKRNKYLKQFINIMCHNGDNHIYSLDGEWGSGKTIFINKIVTLINFYSLYENGRLKSGNYRKNSEEYNKEQITELNGLESNEDYKEIKDMVINNCINAVYFNAWKHDDEDPILSIIYELVHKYNLIDETKIAKSGSLIENIKSLANLLSLNKVDFRTLISDENIISMIEQKYEIKEIVQDILNDIIIGNCNKLIIFVDELDRCNPEYTLNMLERIKHYFDDERIIIVISTNMIELSNIIRCRYGDTFSSERYLDKVIDSRLFLPDIELMDFLNTYDNTFILWKGYYSAEALKCFCLHHKLQMREIDRYYSTVKHFEKFMQHDTPFHEPYFEVIVQLFLPYMVGLYTISISSYKAFIKGQGYSEFKNYVFNNDKILQIFERCLFCNKHTSEELEGYLKNLYEMIYNNRHEKLIFDGNEIYKRDFEDLDKIVCLLGDKADFNEKLGGK